MGENSCRARRMLGHIPAQLSFSRIPATGAVLLWRDPPAGAPGWALCRGRAGGAATCRKSRGLGTWGFTGSEGQGERRRDPRWAAPILPGGSLAGVKLRIGPPNQLPRGGFPAGTGRRAAAGGDDEPPSLPRADGPSAASCPFRIDYPGWPFNDCFLGLIKLSSPRAAVWQGPTCLQP